MSVQTAATMTELPEGARPEEFLRDEDLVGYYERQLAELEPDDPAVPELKVRRKAAIRAAGAVRMSIAEYEAEAAAEIAAAQATEE